MAPLNFSITKRTHRNASREQWHGKVTQMQKTNTQSSWPQWFCKPHNQDLRTSQNKARSKRGVSRASEVLAVVTRSAQGDGGEGQKLLYAQRHNLYKLVFVNEAWLGFLLNSYFYIAEQQAGQLTYK